ncbi:MAG: phosphate starvation-inducible protein PhoH, partial [Deltaproteobacteria bacterium]
MENRAQSETTTRKSITFPDPELLRSLCGQGSSHLRMIEKRLGVGLYLRGNVIAIEGSDWEIDLCEAVLRQLYELLKSKFPLFPNDVDYAIRILSRDKSVNLK